MRLLAWDDGGEIRLTEYFLEHKDQKYAILSHT